MRRALGATFDADLPLLLAAAVVPALTCGALIDRYAIPKILVASVLVAAACALRRRSPPPRSELDAPILALLAAAVVSALLCADPWRAWLGLERLHTWGLFGWIVCALVYWSACGAGEDFPDGLVAWLVAGSLPVSLYALIQKAGWDWNGINAAYFAQRLELRPFSTIGGTVPLGGYLAMVLPLAAFVGLRKQGRPVLRHFGAVAFLLAAAALCATRTRSAWLGALAGLAAYAVILRPRDRRVWGALGAGALACALGLAWVRAGRPTSDVERLEVWRAAAAAFGGHRLVGVGPDGFWTAYKRYRRAEILKTLDGTAGQADANNDWLQVLATLGALGAAAYAWLHARAFLSAAAAVRAGSLTGARAAALASLAALLVFAKLNSVTWAIEFVAALLAACVFRRAATAAGRGLLNSVAMASAASAAACVCVWLAAADHAEKHGQGLRAMGRPRDSLVQLERAIRINPTFPGYRMNLDNLLFDVAESAADLETRRMLLFRATQVALEGVRRHPADPDMLALLGRVELRRHEWGKEPRLEAAVAVLEEAKRLEPNFPQLDEDLARAKALRGK